MMGLSIIIDNEGIARPHIRSNQDGEDIWATENERSRHLHYLPQLSKLRAHPEIGAPNNHKPVNPMIAANAALRAPAAKKSPRPKSGKCQNHG